MTQTTFAINKFFDVEALINILNTVEQKLKDNPDGSMLVKVEFLQTELGASH
jgi:hypothetical protein